MEKKPAPSPPQVAIPVGISFPARRELDIALARDRYKAAHAKLSEAQALEVMEKRQLGPRLEAVELPSYPTSPVRPTRLILLGGLAGGLIVGQLTHLLLAWRSVKRRAAFLSSRKS